MELNNTTQVIVTQGDGFQSIENALLKISLPALVFVFVFSVLGAFGNSIVIHIYWSKWKKNKTRIFVLCLAMLDWINCVFNMPVEIAVLWRPLTFDVHYLCKISRGITYVINNTGSLVLVSIAIERYLLVYHPFRSRQMTPTFAIRMCGLAFLIASCFSWPAFVFYGSHTLSIKIDNNTVIRGKTCLIADEHEIRVGLQLIFTSVLFALLIITFIVLTVLYIAIGRKIYMATCTDFETSNERGISRMFSRSLISAITGFSLKTDGNVETNTNGSNNIPSNSRRHGSVICSDAPSFRRHESEISTSQSVEYSELIMTEKTNTEKTRNGEALGIKKRPRLSRRFSSVFKRSTRKNTVMMRMVTIAFMLSFTPFLVILIIRYTHPMYYYTLNYSGKVAYHVFIRTYFINSMVNPFIYGFMDLHFRNLVKNMFCSMICRRPRIQN